MKRQTYHVVVAGGLNQYGYQDVVEIFNVATSQWTKGKYFNFTYTPRQTQEISGRKLPFGPRGFAASVPFPDVSMQVFENMQVSLLSACMVNGLH